MNSLSVSFTGRASQFCGSVPKSKKAPHSLRLQTNFDTDTKMPGHVVKPAPITSILADMQALGLNMAGAEYFSAQKAYDASRAQMNKLTGPQQQLFTNHHQICRNQGILAEKLAGISHPDVQIANNEEMQEQFELAAESSVGLVQPLKQAGSHFNAARKNQELLASKWVVLKQRELDGKLDATALEALSTALDSVTMRADELLGKYHEGARRQKKVGEEQFALSTALDKKKPSQTEIAQAFNRLSQVFQAQAEDYQACQENLKALVAQQGAVVKAQAKVLDKMVWILEPDKVKVRQAEQAARKGKKLDVSG